MKKKFFTALSTLLRKASIVLLVLACACIFGNLLIKGLVPVKNIISALLLALVFYVLSKFDKIKEFFEENSDELAGKKDILSKILLITSYIMFFLTGLYGVTFIVRLFAPTFAPGIKGSALILAILFLVLGIASYFGSVFVEGMEVPSEKDEEDEEDDEESEEDEEPEEEPEEPKPAPKRKPGRPKKNPDKASDEELLNRSVKDLSVGELMEIIKMINK